uniref:Choline/ethanolamine kinase n=1 Tax=Parascaris univalens TaxID=6257 RepID=A0A914ZMR0_PARUN
MQRCEDSLHTVPMAVNTSCSEHKNLKELFSQPPSTAAVLERTRELCATYLGGIWETLRTDQIRLKVQEGGLNNFNFVVRLPDDVQTLDNEPRSALLRIYCNMDVNEVTVETVIVALLSQRSLGPRLLGIFPGGRLEEFIPSRILTNKEFCNPHVAYEVGRILAHVHSLDMPITRRPRLTDIVEGLIERLRRTERWTKAYKMHTTLAKVDAALCPERITVDLFAEELELVKRCFQKSGSPIVFSNNDLHEGNLLLRDGVEVTDNGLRGRKDEDPLVLIDYEYASYYYRGFDLCHYCVECCQDNTNKSWPYYNIMQRQWPTEQHQRIYIGGYLDKADEIAKAEGGKRPRCVADLPLDREAAIQRLLKEIRQFAACPQLLWAIWSFRQAEEFPLEYDFFEYGFDRMAMYYSWKPEMIRYLNECTS